MRTMPDCLPGVLFNGRNTVVIWSARFFCSAQLKHSKWWLVSIKLNLTLTGYSFDWAEPDSLKRTTFSRSAVFCWLLFCCYCLLGQKIGGARPESQRGSAADQREIRSGPARDQCLQSQVHGGHAGSVWQVSTNGGAALDFLQRCPVQHPQRIKH